MLRRLSWVCSLSFLLTSNLINYPTPTFTARQLIDVDCVEFENYRNEMIEKVQAYEKYKIEEQKRIEAEQERLRQEELERQRIEEEKTTSN